MGEKFSKRTQEAARRARKQSSIWVSTDELITLLSQYMRVTKTEVVHLAVTDLASAALKRSTDAAFKRRMLVLLRDWRQHPDERAEP